MSSTHCETCGEEFTEENTLIDKRGKRRCRNCHRVSMSEHNALMKQAKEALGIPWSEYRATYEQSKTMALAIIAGPKR